MVIHQKITIICFLVSVRILILGVPNLIAILLNRFSFFSLFAHMLVSSIYITPLSSLRVILADRCRSSWMIVCTWQEWWAGVTVVLAETSQASTQKYQDSGPGSRRRQEYKLLGDYNELWESFWTVLFSQVANVLITCGITQHSLAEERDGLLTCFV